MEESVFVGASVGEKWKIKVESEGASKEGIWDFRE